jgi:hypothetical protein
MTYFGNSYTYTVPANAKSFTALLIGGGGGGGTGSGKPGGGGGGGGFSVGYWPIVAGQTTISITVGAGGMGGCASANSTGYKNTNGQAGQATIVTYNSIPVTAGGGSGGVYNASSVALGGTGTGTTINGTTYSGANGQNGFYYGQSGNPSASNFNCGGNNGYPFSSSSGYYPTANHVTTVINYTFIPTTAQNFQTTNQFNNIGIGQGGEGSNQPVSYTNGLGAPGLVILYFSTAVATRSG